MLLSDKIWQLYIDGLIDKVYFDEQTNIRNVYTFKGLAAGKLIPCHSICMDVLMLGTLHIVWDGVYFKWLNHRRLYVMVMQFAGFVRVFLLRRRRLHLRFYLSIYVKKIYVFD